MKGSAPWISLHHKTKQSSRRKVVSLYVVLHVFVQRAVIMTPDHYRNSLDTACVLVGMSELFKGIKRFEKLCVFVEPELHEIVTTDLQDFTELIKFISHFQNKTNLDIAPPCTLVSS
jgi:hypothetical protein